MKSGDNSRQFHQCPLRASCSHDSHDGLSTVGQCYIFERNSDQQYWKKPEDPNGRSAREVARKMVQVDLASLIAAIPLEWRNAVRNVYLIGSRAWADRSLDSGSIDWDFFMVIDGYNSTEHGIELTDPALRDCVDISAYSCERWTELIGQHELLCLMCLYLPKRLVWREEFIIPRFRICLKKLVRGVMKERTKTFDMAHRAFVVEKNFYLGRKNIVHCLRYLNFGIQLMQNNPILDTSCAKHFYNEVIYSTDEDWKSVEAKYKPRVDALATQLKSQVEQLILAEVAHCNKEILLGSPLEMVAQHLHRFPLIQQGLDYLVTKFACDIAYFALPDGADICRIRSSIDSPTVAQCPLMAGYHCLFWNNTTNEMLGSSSIAPVVYDDTNPVGSAAAVVPLLSHAWAYIAVPTDSFFQEGSFDPKSCYTLLLPERAAPQILLALDLQHSQLVRSFPQCSYNTDCLEGLGTDAMIAKVKRLLSRCSPLQTECILVLCDAMGLVAFPSPARVALTDILSESKALISVTRLLPLVRATWPNSAASLIPQQFRATFAETEEKYSKLCALVSSLWMDLQPSAMSEADFASQVTGRGSKYKPFAPILFRLRAAFVDSTPHECNVVEELRLIPLASVLAAMDRIKP